MHSSGEAQVPAWWRWATFYASLVLLLALTTLAARLRIPTSVLVIGSVWLFIGGLYTNERIARTGSRSKPIAKDLLFNVANVAFSRILNLTIAACLAAFGQVRGSTIGADNLPFPLQILIFWVLTDFIRYWVHRIQHRVPALWRLHQIHHSVEHVYSLNAIYSHPIDYLLRNVLPVTLILSIFQFDPTAILFAMMSTNGVSLLSHTDFPMSNRVLAHIFAIAPVHRWHHSSDPTEGNTNFGVITMIWDHLFGTFYLPRDRDAPDRYGLREKHIETRFREMGFLRSIVWPLGESAGSAQQAAGEGSRPAT
jgi:sterol desaturase/sphingolipid hydroxylase (fatty acid hydroxylase superfamily)